MELLQSPEDRGYPTEYLLSRIRGRRKYLTKDLEPLLFTPDPFESLMPTLYGEFITEHSIEGVWRRLLKEFNWVYLQMNKRLRDVFRPFFLYSETKTLVFCFRHKIRKDAGERLELLLSLSILSEKIKEVLRMEADLPAVLEVFEGGLKEVFLKEGLKGVEQRLTGVFLEQIISLELHPVIKRFFTYIIDSKNIVAFYKHLRWGVTADPLFIPGGSIGESRLRRVIHTHEISGMEQLIYQLTGQRVKEPTASHVENELLRGLTKLLKLMGREPSGIGLILDYLWRCYIDALNLSIILYGRGIDRDVLKEELIH